MMAAVENIDEYVEFANSLADIACPILISAYQEGHDFEMKSDGSPVTAIDRKVEALMWKEIAATYPDHGIFGEEFGTENLDRDFVWVLDPIDGTKAFTSGIPTFGCLIALCHKGKLIIGIIEAPAAGFRAVGAQGRQTLVNGSIVKTRECSSLNDAILMSSGPDSLKAAESALSAMRQATNWRVYDNGCVGYISIARGFIDVGFEGNLDPHDFCPLVPVIEGAGGVITDWKGGALTINSGPRIVIAGKNNCHEEMLKILSGY